MLSGFLKKAFAPPAVLGLRLRKHPYDYGHALHYDELFNGQNLDRYPILQLVRELSPRRVLDAGGGSGRIAAPLCEAGYPTTLLDLSEAMIRQGETRKSSLSPSAQSRFQIQRGDVCHFKAPGAYDLVLSVNNLFEHLLEENQIEQAFKNLYESVAPGGHLFLEVHNPEYCRQEETWKKGSWRPIEYLYFIEGRRSYLWERTFSGRKPDQVVWEHAVSTNRFHYSLLQTEIRIHSAEFWILCARRQGWKEESVWGSWEKDPLSDSRPKIIIGLSR